MWRLRGRHDERSGAQLRMPVLRLCTRRNRKIPKLFFIQFLNLSQSVLRPVRLSQRHCYVSNQRRRSSTSRMDCGRIWFLFVSISSSLLSFEANLNRFLCNNNHRPKSHHWVITFSTPLVRARPLPNS